MTEVKLARAFDPNDPPLPPPPLYPTSALWDTGATASCITPSVANALSLSPIGARQVIHAGGVQVRNTYLVNVYLPNMVAISGVTVSEFEETAQFGMIVGMDVIAQGDLSITNLGNETWASFRIPSVHHIDYVQDANKAIFAGVGRNDPCPCGKKDTSGRPVKFKKCHGMFR